MNQFLAFQLRRFPRLHGLIKACQRVCLRWRGQSIEMIRRLPPPFSLGLLRGVYSDFALLQAIPPLHEGRIVLTNQGTPPTPPNSMMIVANKRQHDFQPWPIFWIHLREAELIGPSLAHLDRHGFISCEAAYGRSVDDPRLDESLPLRAFRPGLDEVAWLEVNNQAFAGHPEQGGWGMETIVEREQEPWFDPEGFLVLEVDGRMWGSCWTKVHRDADPPLGEIYVIGVSPDAQGRGWGRALTRAGLEWLTGRGLRVGMLYVDGGNTAAVGLYRSMGFVDHHVDRAYLRRIAGQPTPTR